MDDLAAIRARETPARLVDAYQSRGRYTFTRSEMEAAGDRSAAAVRAALRRLGKQGRVAMPRRGFYVIVPVEYRVAGCPPASWFIDDLMAHLGQPYYVALLSAAALHGAAHQQPMAFQVMTDRPTRSATAGRVRIEFHASALVGSVPSRVVATETGSMRVATPEVTAFDLVRHSAASGHLSNVATVLSELAERIAAGDLVALAPLYKLPDVQRLGFLLERTERPGVAEPLASWLRDRRHRPVLLSPAHGAAHRGRLADPRWRVIPNVAIEADL